MSDPADFEAAFTSAVDRAARELAGEAEEIVSDHPGVDALVDFQEGQLSANNANRVKRHLAACPQCAGELRTLEGFADDSADSDPRPSPEQTAADWARFQTQIASETAEGKVLTMSSASRPPQPESELSVATTGLAGGATRRRARDWLPIAASLLIGLIGIGSWIASHRIEPTGTSPGTRNPYAFDLVPDGEDRVRDAAILPEVVVPAGMDALLPRLNLGDQTPYDAYRAEIADDAGSIVWSQGELRRQPAGQFVVVVENPNMPVGTYRLSVFGLGTDEETVLAIYTFELSYAAEP